MTTVKITGTSAGVVLQQSGQTITISIDDAHAVGREIIQTAWDVRAFEMERKRRTAEMAGTIVDSGKEIE